MAQSMSRSWWGQKFLQALEVFTDSNRLARGRRYASGGKIKSWEIKQARVTAKVRGSINPYFNVYKEPLYTTSVALGTIPEAKWQQLIDHLGNRAGMITRLLLNEIPEGIEEVFQILGLNLLPANSRDFTTRCSCPDYANPCKHVAGVCYVLAEQLDQDPILLFELRGLSRQALREALLKTPLGQALATSLGEQQALEPQLLNSYYTRPQRQPVAAIPAGRYWGEAGALPGEPPTPMPPALPAVLIRKGGNHPPFWDRDHSFVDIMAELYERVRKSNQNI